MRNLQVEFTLHSSFMVSTSVGSVHLPSRSTRQCSHAEHTRGPERECHEPQRPPTPRWSLSRSPSSSTVSAPCERSASEPHHRHTRVGLCSRSCSGKPPALLGKRRHLPSCRGVSPGGRRTADASPPCAWASGSWAGSHGQACPGSGVHARAGGTAGPWGARGTCLRRPYHCSENVRAGAAARGPGSEAAQGRSPRSRGWVRAQEVRLQRPTLNFSPPRDAGTDLLAPLRGEAGVTRIPKALIYILNPSFLS